MWLGCLAWRSQARQLSERGVGRRIAQQRWWRAVLSGVFIVAMGACGTDSGCGGCSSFEPLPTGGLPAKQTVEGGAQVRVTPHGFATLASVLPGLLNEQLSGGFCLPAGEYEDPIFGATLASYCKTNQTCPGGCLVKPTINSVGVGPHASNAQALTLQIDARATATLPVSVIGLDCNLTVLIEHLKGAVDVVMTTNATTGQLALTANPIAKDKFSLSEPKLGNCGFGGDIISFFVNLFKGTVADTIRNQLSPAIQNLLPAFLPDTLGIENTVNVGGLITSISPGTTAKLEARFLVGGYAHTSAGGLSVGMITGLNADRDPATRSAGLDSEPARCVPALAAPNLGATLPLTSRGTYRLDAAGAFDGVPDPGGNADVAVGISKTTLRLLGHHAITSGALCLGIGTAQISQLSVGTISLLVPSLAEIVSGTGKDPLLLVTRPTKPLAFTIGENTAASPAISVGIEHLEIDFYAFLFDRYVRVFTTDISMTLGVNLEFEQVAGAPISIKPILMGIEPSAVQVSVVNSQFVRESPDILSALLPTILSLVTPALGDLPELAVPSFAGFALKDLSIKHVATPKDDFLAVYASLGPSAALAATAAREPMLQRALDKLSGPRTQATSTGTARLVDIATPSPERVRAAYLGGGDGARPRVTFDVDRVDAAGRELEWAYRLDNGMWRPWRAGGALAIEDDAFAWQGKYTIGLKSRAKGDYTTVSTTTEFPVAIDSAPPRVALDQAAWQGDRYTVPAFDEVSEHALQFALGKPSRASPDAAWRAGAPTFDRDDASAYAEGGAVAVYVRDEVGNIARVEVDGVARDSGGCATSRAPSTGGLLLLAIVGSALLVPRRRRRSLALAGLWLVGGAVLASQPGCSCGSSSKDMAPTTCEEATDCSADACDPGTIPFCIDNTCVCADGVPAGRIGPYSDVAVANDGAIWVSAYAQSHGDLVVAKTTGGRIADEAWEWVDGVPDGPVIVPDGKVRDGIDEDGPDVGMYTSIAIAPDGTPMVAYFDRTTASLKLAQRINGAWQIHVVDEGTGTLGELGKLAGMYASLTLRSDDGRPGIAYLAHIKDARGTHAEVRFVSAQSPHPTAAADWQSWTVDTAPLPAADANNPEVYPLPAGLGLFIDAARLPDETPVVAYYDRSNGDLELAKLDVKTGQFAARRLDGSGNVDAGWTPSIAVSGDAVVHVAYVGRTADDLKLTSDVASATPEIIDDGYRSAGTTADGLDKPEFHLVGDDANLLIGPTGALVVYQDATTQELLLAQKTSSGAWERTSIAGGKAPWAGGYGFYASAAVGPTQLVMSTFAVNLSADTDAGMTWVEVFTRPLAQP